MNALRLLAAAALFAAPSVRATEYPGSLVEEYEKDVAAGRRDASDLDAARVIDRERGSWESTLRGEAEKRGLEFHDSDVDDIIRHVSYGRNAGKDPSEFLENALRKYDERMAPTYSAGGCGGDADRDGDCRGDSGENAGVLSSSAMPRSGSLCHPRRDCVGADKGLEQFACARDRERGGWRWTPMRNGEHPCAGGSCDVPQACR